MMPHPERVFRTVSHSWHPEVGEKIALGCAYSVMPESNLTNDVIKKSQCYNPKPLKLEGLYFVDIKGKNYQCIKSTTHHFFIVAKR